ncbi:hypothetical protein CQA66_03825 [Helicobacter aurati]|uniref:Uncharacterized protein n=1 Tax=Helicobacter aurati TaxID=137778 RepID=A0A3D8J7A8_9HELI|nr:hypothetical protein [Helicobacter aurati]RDU72731.1 hypothetical protein CQA66_03825 [Helicobacter aurati]
MVKMSVSLNPAIFGGKGLLHKDINYKDSVDTLLIEPLLSGNAYYVDIINFSALHSHELLNRYDEFGLSRDIINGYVNDYDMFLTPYVVQFEFRYQQQFLDNIKDLSAKMSLSNHCDNSIRDLRDLRTFQNPCIAFGDFSLSYIDKEGWYGMSDVYWDFFEVIRLEHSRMIAHKLRKMSSYLYFSFVDSEDEPVVKLYSDFRDYRLVSYDKKPLRQISRLLVNTKRHTFATYQVEPLSPMALSYYNRLFFLVKQNPEENHYAFIVFFSEEEISRIAVLKTWACAEK